MATRLALFHLLVIPLLLVAAVASAEDDPCGQTYTNWKRHPSGKYYYCKYFFRPKPDAARKVQIVVWFPDEQENQHTYYFDPGNQVYWCRAINHYHDDYKPGADRWNVLKEGKNKFVERIVKWPDKLTVPDVPGSDGLAKMKPPPKPPQFVASQAK